MDVELYTPRRPGSLINKIWLVTSSATENYQMLPESSVNLIFHLTPGSDHRGLEGKLIRNSLNTTQGFCFLTGMHAKPVNFYSTDFQSICVELHPLAANTLFGIPCSALNNMVVEGDLILNDLNKVEDKLQGAGSFSEKAKWLEDYLYSKINETSELITAKKMHNTIIEMHRDLLLGKKVDIQEHTGFSRMHTHRLSTQWLGLSPKKYLRLQQFIKTLNDLHFTPRSFSEVAIANGFYDQTHFNRVFKSLADMTPRHYQQRKSALPGQLFS